MPTFLQCLHYWIDWVKPNRCFDQPTQRYMNQNSITHRRRFIFSIQGKYSIEWSKRILSIQFQRSGACCIVIIFNWLEALYLLWLLFISAGGCFRTRTMSVVHYAFSMLFWLYIYIGILCSALWHHFNSIFRHLRHCRRQRKLRKILQNLTNFCSENQYSNRKEIEKLQYYFPSIYPLFEIDIEKWRLLSMNVCYFGLFVLHFVFC